MRCCCYCIWKSIHQKHCPTEQAAACCNPFLASPCQQLTKEMNSPRVSRVRTTQKCKEKKKAKMWCHTLRSVNGIWLGAELFPVWEACFVGELCGRVWRSRCTFDPILNKPSMAELFPVWGRKGTRHGVISIGKIECCGYYGDMSMCGYCWEIMM